MTEPVVTACACTGEPIPFYREDGAPAITYGGQVVCRACGQPPFGKYRDLPDSEGGEA
jgi:hypothetical protein